MSSTKAMESCGSYFAGALFATGWFVFFDAVANNAKNGGDPAFRFEWILPSICGLAGLILMNIIPWHLIAGDGLGSDNTARARCVFFISNVLLWAGVGGAIAIDAVHFKNATGNTGPALIVQNVFTMVSAFFLRLTRRPSGY